jgi:glycosyltransferase involved in cell wall biosynthesis
MPPAVSVIITIFNTEKYLGDAISSILAQTWSDLELILIDDGSTDGSLRVIQEFARRDARVRFASRENRGIVRSSNEGLAMARGEFIARMDSDDISMPERLERQIAFLRANPEVVAVSGWYQLVDAKGRRLRRIKMPLDDAAIQKCCLDGITALCHGCVTIRRSAFDAVGGYDDNFERATEDHDLFLRLGEVGKLANIPEVLLKYRLHDRSFGARNRQLQFDMVRVACERAWQRRGVQGEFLPAESWRPSEDRESRHKFLVECGWWAFNSGERRTAIIYGLKAVAKWPLNSTGWRLLVCAIVKRQSPENRSKRSLS